MIISFFRRSSKTKGWCTIYLRICINGVRLEVCSTGIKVPLSDWDNDRDEVKSKHPEASTMNIKLATMKVRLQTIYNNYFTQQKPVSAEVVKQEYLGDTKPIRLLDGMGTQISELERLRNEARAAKRKPPKGAASNTIRNFRSAKSLLFHYLKKRRLVGLFATEFDEDRFADFIEYAHGLGHKNSTIRARAVLVKRSLIWMKRKKMIPFNPLNGVPLPPDSSSEPSPLTTEQLERLRLHQFKSPQMQRYADLFVVHCYTGFHYQDLQDLIKQAREKKWKPKRLLGVDWVVLKRGKTEVSAKIPILPALQELLIDKYGGDWGNLPTVSDKTFNLYLKLIAAELDLPEKLCISNGRDTLADWLFNVEPVTDATVKVILGRNDLRDIKRYAAPDERRVEMELRHVLKKK